MSDRSCPTCGRPNAADARWCGNCGTNLESAGPAARGLLRDFPWRVIAIVVVVVVVAGVVVALTGEAEGPDEGRVAFPADAPQPVDGLPVDPGLVVWDTTRPAGAAVAASEDLVILGDRRGLEKFERDTGRRRGGVGLSADPVRALGSSDRRTVFAAGSELIMLEGRVGTGGVDARFFGDVAGAAEPLPGTGPLLRRVLFGDALYVLAGSHLVAVEPTGGERWRWAEQHVLSAGTTSPGPYVVAVNGVIGLDPRTGEIRWRQPLVTFDNRSHVVTRGRIVIADDQGNVTALDVDDGQVRWQTDLGGPLAQRLALVDEAVVAAYLGGTVVAYEGGSGRLMWTFSRTGVRFELLVGGGDVVALADPGRPESTLHVLDARTGERLWQRPAHALGDVVIDGDRLLLVAGTTVTSVDARTGRQRWSLDVREPVDVVDADGDAVLATPTRVLVVETPAG